MNTLIKCSAFKIEGVYNVHWRFLCVLLVCCFRLKCLVIGQIFYQAFGGNFLTKNTNANSKVNTRMNAVHLNLTHKCNETQFIIL